MELKNDNIEKHFSLLAVRIQKIQQRVYYPTLFGTTKLSQMFLAGKSESGLYFGQMKEEV